MKLVIAALVGAAGTAAVSAGVLGASSAGDAPHATERGFEIHTRATAPEEMREVLAWYEQNFGFVPHLTGVMAEAPALGVSYWQLQTNLQSMGTLTPPEDNIVQTAIAVANACQYCVAGHTLAGRVFFESPEEQLEALRSGSSLPEARFDALRDFALAVHETRGRVSEDDLRSFYAAGYTRAQALDVVANVAAKVMSNYTNQLARTPLDEPLKPLAEGLPFGDERRLIAR